MERFTGKQDVQAHWDAIYQRSETSRLGWYEESPEPSLRLIRESGISKNGRILYVSAGATTLVDKLLGEGYSNQVAMDISGQALQALQRRLGKGVSREVEWVVDDLADPSVLRDISPVNLWHDRAVLHFFTEEREREAYFALLRRLLLPGGWAVIAAFHLNGAPKCSGLPVRNYDEKMLAGELGSDFQMLRAFPYQYIMPSGEERLYIYTLFQRRLA